MHSEAVSNLTHHFLLAMPGLSDPNFVGSVVYIADHSERGAMGLVINRPMDMDLNGLLEHINLVSSHPPGGESPVLYGGPVQTDRGLVLHSPVGNWSSTMKITPELGLTSSKDILEAFAAGQGPEQIMVVLGYSGWGPGQLETEIAGNAWLTTPAEPDLLFDVPADDRLDRAFGLLGINPAFLSSEAGHA